ncbi:MAG: hypothetical protein GX062_07575 [Firmicutes bacterium]|nr:hypothetical protein [Bacillota bacterium]
MDDRITAGYLFTNSAAEAKPNPNMSIVLRVSQNSPALSSLAKWFDAQLLAEYKRIVEPTAVPSRPLLDLYVVTEAEIAQRAGLAALIGSTHTQLLLLWERAS